MSSGPGQRCTNITAHRVRLDRLAIERLADPSPDPMIVVRPSDGVLLYCNQSFTDICGVRTRWMSRAMGEGTYAHKLLQFSDTELLPNLVKRAARLQQTLAASSICCRNHTPESELVLTLVATPIDSFDQEAPAVIVVFKDTTSEHRVQEKYQKLLAAKRKHAEELESKVRERTQELAQAQNELLQATRLAAIGEVASTAAHEVLNPLTAVAGNLENMSNTLLDGDETLKELTTLVQTLLPQLDSQVSSQLANLCHELSEDFEQNRKRIDIVCRASHRIERIIQGLSGMSRATSEPEVLNLSQVVKEVHDLMSYSFDRAKVHLEVPAPPPTLRVYADHGEILQVLTNLLHNACQAAKQAYPTSGGRVHMGVKLSTQAVEVHVEDNGVGVPKDLRSRIFEPGFTTKPRGEGSGLGLSIARRLIRRHGGDLHLHVSKNPGGTTMVVILPQQMAHQDAPINISSPLKVNV
ncbi:MAG: PAS domain-containing sensor histidine kinase [Myxococcales bacterium]|nr:PAS domain-containing sensor histidine kinase [Myxococcales bacterium]